MTRIAPVVLLAMSLLFLGARSPAGRAFVIVGAGVCALLALARRDTNANHDGAGAGLLLDDPWRVLAVAALPMLALLRAVVDVATGSAASLAASIEAPFLLGAYALVLLTLLAATRHASGVAFVLTALVALGLLEAAYGAFNFLAGNERLLVYKRWAYFDSATGTLVNRNHFAYLLEMTIPLAFVALIVAPPAAARRATPLAREDAARRMLLGLGVALMLLALLLSRSRMGLASMVVAVVLVLGLDRALRPVSERASGNARGAGLAVMAVAVFLMAGVGLDVAFERFSAASHDLEAGRLPIWQQAWPMVVAHPVLGSGFDSFQYLFPAYGTDPTGFFYDHPHSEYLAVLIEFGVVGLLVVVAWIVLFGRRLVRSLRAPLDPLRRRRLLAVSIGIVSVLIHSTVDFGLRIPGVALTFLFIVALFLRLSVDKSSASPTTATTTP